MKKIMRRLLAGGLLTAAWLALLLNQGPQIVRAQSGHTRMRTGLYAAETGQSLSAAAEEETVQEQTVGEADTEEKLLGEAQTAQDLDLHTRKKLPEKKPEEPDTDIGEEPEEPDTDIGEEPEEPNTDIGEEPEEPDADIGEEPEEPDADVGEEPGAEAEAVQPEKQRIVRPEQPQLFVEMALDAPERVRMYDQLPISVRLTCDGRDYTHRILDNEHSASIEFVIKSRDKEVRINSKALDRETGTAHQYNIPIDKEHFNSFLPGEVYTVCALLYFEKEACGGCVPYRCEPETIQVTLSERTAAIMVSGCEESYDYRACFGADKPIRLQMDIRDSTDADNPDKAVLPAEISRIRFVADGYDDSVINVGSDNCTPAYNSMGIHIRGVGTTSITVHAVGSAAYAAAAEEIRIVVRNSPLLEEDFVIRYTPEGSRQPVDYCFDEWEVLLAAQRGWVNGAVTIALSDEGRKYYNALAEQGQSGRKSDTIVIEEDALRRYCFWAEHTGRNASTREAENGTREFTAGIDTTAPVISGVTVDERYFAPTKTETRQYYAQDFVLCGSVSDIGSGVKAIEYTTDYDVRKKEPEWLPIEAAAYTGGGASFCITLGNGIYHAIAVRAWDYAGNVSDLYFVKNEEDAFISIIVDNTAPTVRVQAFADGAPYTGEGGNWTNAGVSYRLSGSGLAGVYQYEYAYESIGAVLSGDLQPGDVHEWETLVPDAGGEGRLRVGFAQRENRNGYYYFQAVSKSGVKSDAPVSARILLQQSLAELKEHVQTPAKSGRKDEWYNKASGVPIIRFVYPEYDSGVHSGEYAAPITLHYKLWVQEETGAVLLRQEGKAEIGVTQTQRRNEDGFAVTEENLEKHCIRFGYDSASGYAQDGIYTLEYWIDDRAGNTSERRRYIYKIDTHEPSGLTVAVDGAAMEVDSASPIVYERFYAGGVAGSASAEYGISGRASIKVIRAEKIGDWDGTQEEGDRFEIAPCTRCFLYVIAEDGAGNTTEGWTRGIVVDDRPPAGMQQQELIVEPQGANANGFYNRDIEIKIAVKDMPDNGCAGLMRVACAVGADLPDAAADRELFAFTKELPTQEELCAASQYEVLQVIDAKANESNQAFFSVTALDRCGNTATTRQALKIDVTRPEITIEFDNCHAQNGSYYNAPRTALICAREVNFDSSLVTVTVTRNGQEIAPEPLKWESRGDEHYASLPFTEDGDYMLSVRCTDLADNVSEEVSVSPFTIDRTKPAASVRFMGNDINVVNSDYFHAKVTAVITVMEHNFNPAAVDIKTDVGVRTGTWHTQGDAHTLEMVFEGDGRHMLTVEAADLAGNRTEPAESVTFVIDTAPPEIVISGVADESANAGEVLPVITVRDANLEQGDISIEAATGSGRRVPLQGVWTSAREDKTVEYVCALPEMTNQEDDIYYLTVAAADRAGNKASRGIRFSLNRRGSAYDLSALFPVMDAYYNRYETLGDIKITEMNVDVVEECRFYLSRNGEMLPQVILSEAAQSGSERLGYTYVYTLARENFAQEGVYRLGIYSRDRAGNEVNNTLEANGEAVAFVIDNTPPGVLIDGASSGMLYDTAAHTVRVMVTDNFALDKAEFMLVNKAGETLQRWDYFELAQDEDGIAALTIPECAQELSLLFRAQDAAGNETAAMRGSDAAPSDFLVTTDKWIQIIKMPAKTMLGRLSAGAAVTGVIALFPAFVLYCKKYKPK